MISRREESCKNLEYGRERCGWTARSVPEGTKLSAGLDRIKLHDMDRKINRRIFILSIRDFFFFMLFTAATHLSPLLSLFLSLPPFFLPSPFPPHPFPPLSLSLSGTATHICSFIHSLNARTSCRSCFLKIRVVSGCFALATHMLLRVTVDVQEIMAAVLFLHEFQTTNWTDWKRYKSNKRYKSMKMQSAQCAMEFPLRNICSYYELFKKFGDFFLNENLIGR